MIWALGVLVGMLAIVGVALPWLWPAFAQRRGLGRRTANVAAYRGRLRELDADAAAGVVAPDAVATVKDELAARLLADTDAPAPPTPATAGSRLALVLAAIGLLLFGGIWYAAAGSWRTHALYELAKTDPELARAASLDQMIERLRNQVAKSPDDAESWAWLGRSYRNRGNFGDAAAAFARASRLKGEQDPDLLAEEGEALAFAQDRNMAGAPAAKFAQALALAPDHTQALWYSGIAALQGGDDRAAITHWERLARQELPADTRATLEHSLSRLRARSGIAAVPAPAAGVALKIEVTVAPALAGEVRPDDALFVYAVEPGGPPMPLAVQRLRGADLPAKLVLDDSTSMIPTRKLSAFQKWRVIARVSRAGSATPQPGDLEGDREVARQEAAKPVSVVIDRRRS